MSDRNPRFIILSFSLLCSKISKETGKKEKKKHYHKTINDFLNFLPFFFLRYNFLFYKASGTSLVVCRVDRNPPANAGDIGWIPGPGGFHVPQSN